MKQYFRPLSYVTLICSLLATAPMYADTTTDTTLDQQKTDCAKNSASEWSATMNRCITKVEAKNTQIATEACAALTDIEQQKACYKKIAEDKSGLNSDPNSLPQGTTGKSAIMNGAASAYAILGMINGLGSGNRMANCTSKKIFGYTAFAGLATDLWLKIQAKKKLNALKDKYQIDVTKNAYDAQIKAFQYLKEEQETVKEIAEGEKKRNLLLTLGYGAASAMAIYEMMFSQANSQCFVKEKTEPSPTPTPTPTPAAPATADTGSTDTGITCGEGETQDGNVCIGKVSAPEKIESTPLAADKQQPAVQTIQTQPQTTETPVDTTPKDKYVVTGSGSNMRVRGVDDTGSYNGTAIVTHGSQSYVINDRTGAVIGPVSSNADISWKDGRSSPIPSSLVSSSSGGVQNIKFNGTTDMNVDGKTFKLKR